MNVRVMEVVIGSYFSITNPIEVIDAKQNYLEEEVSAPLLLVKYGFANSCVHTLTSLFLAGN